MSRVKILILIILFSLFIRFYNLDFNSAFTDEAFYVYVGKVIFDGEAPNVLTYVFGSYLAPVVLASADAIGGLLAARFVNLIFGLVTVFFVYLFTKELLNEKIALLASLLFSIQAPVIFVSIFATHDALSICLFSAAMYFFIRGTKKGNLLAVSSIFMFLSIMTKYLSLIFFPFMIIYLIRKKINPITFILPATLLLILYSFIYFPSLLSLTETYSGMHVIKGNAFIVFSTLLSFLTIPILLSISSFRFQKHIYLFIAALIIPVYHIITINDISLFKHVSFSLMFLSPLMALILYRIRKYAIPIIIAIMAISFIQLDNLQHFYPNTGNAVEWLKDNTNNSSLLLTETAVYRYYLYDIHGNIYDTYWFDYNGNNKDEIVDYEQAIKDGFFDFIVLDFTGTPEKSKEILGFLDKGYKPVFKDGPIRIFSIDD